MMKRIFTIVAALAVGFFTISCSGNKSNENEETSVAEEVAAGMSTENFTETYLYHSADGQDITIKVPAVEKQAILLNVDGQESVLNLIDSVDDVLIFSNNDYRIEMQKSTDKLVLKSGDNATEFVCVDPVKRTYTSANDGDMQVTYRDSEGKRVAEVVFNANSTTLAQVEAAAGAATYEGEGLTLKIKDNKATLVTPDKTIEFEEQK